MQNAGTELNVAVAVRVGDRVDVALRVRVGEKEDVLLAERLVQRAPVPWTVMIAYSPPSSGER